MTSDCPFCDIAKEDRILKEGRFAYVIFSNPRLMPGHLLVIPKRHVYQLTELIKEEKEEIFDFLVEFQDKIINKLSAGCDIRLNFKPYVKNSTTHVNHMHFHLLPRESQDELQQKAEQHKDPLYKILSEEEKTQLTSLFK